MITMSESESAAPLDVVEATVGEAVTIRLKDEQMVYGMLEGYDEHLNVVLSNVETNPAAPPTDEQASETGEGMLVIRGQMVVTITQPPATPDTSEATGTDDHVRAEKATDSDTDDDEATIEDTDPRGAALAALHERLTNHGLDVQTADDDQLLIVEKLGVTYHIRPDRSIEGNGPHREQIERLVTG